MIRATALLALAACTKGGDGDSAPDTDPGQRTESVEFRAQVPCDNAGDEGIAVWIQTSAAPRYADGDAVILVIHPFFKGRFSQSGLQNIDAIAAGLTVVRYLDTGTDTHEQASGGVDDEGGPSRVPTIECVASWLQSDESPVQAAALIGVSLSSGSASGLGAMADGVDLDGMVLWEPPILDQLIQKEVGLRDDRGEVAWIDPTFVPGSCTLTAGCVFPDRPPQIRVDGAAEIAWRDVDGSGVYETGEPVYPLESHMISQEMWDEIASQPEETVFPTGKPDWWPTREAVLDFWTTRAGTDPLVHIRDAGLGRWILVATGDDHVQVTHDNIEIGRMALRLTSFFRLNPDQVYMTAAQAGPGGDMPPDGDLDTLTEVEDGPLMVAGALELADRVHEDVWDPNLDALLVDAP